MEARFVCRPEEMYQRYEPNIHQRKGVTCKIYISVYVYHIIIVQLVSRGCVLLPHLPILRYPLPAVT